MLLVMAGVTYLVRMVPFALFRKRIDSTIIKSFLYYVPYAVLGAMTIPAVFYSTGNGISAAAGFICCLIPAFFGRSLITVALTASAAAFITELLLHFMK